MSSLAGRDAGLGAPGYVGQVVRAPKTAELIATLYRRQIVRGDLRPGDTLPSEQQLMVQFGVSRPTLREAFRILEAEDLISVKRGSRGGARVTQPSLSVAARFHELIMQRSGSKTLAVQGGVLQDIVATHLAMALSRDRAGDDELANFRRNVRSYEKLVALVDKRDGAGAERHWRAHMEAAGQRLLREDLQSRSVVDLFS